MKVQFLLSLLIVGVAAANFSQARADYHPERGYRYQVRYSEWDRGMRGYYGHTETDCRVSYSPGVTYSTCYEFTPSQPVYIEEQHYSGGYHRVVVYETQHAVNPYATYYIYDDGHTRRVERREFHHHRHYREVYYHPYYHHHEEVWVTLDWNNGWDKIFIGSYTILIGADILAHSGTSEAAAIIGLSVMASGSISASLGSRQLHKESQLAKYIAKQEKDADSATDVE